MHPRLGPLFLLCLPAVATAASGECPAPASNADIVALLDQADAALDATDVDGFRGVVEQVAMNLPCMNEPIIGSSAARLHALQGIRQYVAGETEAAGASFLAARALDPSASLPDALFPEGHEIHAAFHSGDIDAVASVTVPAPKDQTLIIDGVTTRAKPVDRPFIGQLEGSDGMAQTRYLTVGEPVIDYDINPLSLLTSSGKRGRMLQIGLGTATAAGVAYGLQWKTLGDFQAHEDGTLTPNDAAAKRLPNLLATAASTGLAVATIGFVFGARNADDE